MGFYSKKLMGRHAVNETMRQQKGESMVIENAGYGPDYPFTRGYQLVVTLFERDVVIGLLESVLNGWEGDQARQNAAMRVLKKLKGEL